MAREILKMNYGTYQPPQPVARGGLATLVQSISDVGGLHRSVEKLNEDMRDMRMDLRPRFQWTSW